MGTKTRTKLYSTLLSVMMLVNLVPTPTLAEGEPQPTETPVIVQTETPAAEPETNITEEPTPAPATEEVPVIPVEETPEPVSTETPVPEQQEGTPCSRRDTGPEQEETQDADSKETDETETDSEEDAEESEEDPEESEEETENEEVSYPAVTLSETVEGVTVTLSAPEGSLPEGVHMTVTPVHEQAIFEAVDGTLAEEGKEIASAVAFDITLYDAKDNELQPNKYVTVSFSNTNLSSNGDNSTIDVYRVSDDASEVTPVTTIAATDNNQMFITNHFTIYLASSDKKTIHGSLEDPNGDSTNQPNGQGHRYYLEYGESITLESNEDSIFTDEWYIHGTTYNGAITQTGDRTFKNTNLLESYEIATIAHKYGFLGRNVEYFFVSLRPQTTYNVVFKFCDAGKNEFPIISTQVIKKNFDANLPVTPPFKYIGIKTYVFSGWCSDQECTNPIPARDLNRVERDITAYGKYTESKNTYAVVFNGNADDCTYIPSTLYGSTNPVTGQPFKYAERPAYTCKGWATSLEGASEGTVEYLYPYEDGFDIPEGKQVLELYAVWEETDETLSYAPNNYSWGSVSPSYEYVKAINGTAQGATATPKNGYQFVKWIDNKGNVLSTEPTFVPQKTDEGYYVYVRHTAVFEPISYTVTFNTNGGSTIEPQHVIPNGTAIQPQNPTKGGTNSCFQFAGWYKDSETTPFDFTTVITSDITLNAKWTHSGNHMEGHLTPAVPATCETGGNVNGYYCFSCGKYFEHSDGKTEITDFYTPALGHDWEDPQYPWADDYSSITATRHCKRDSCTKTETEAIHLDTSLTEPTPGKIISRTFGEPTCTTPGGKTYIAVFKNPAFEVQVKSLNDKPALGHDWPTEVGEGKVTFSWSSDYSSVDAVAHCQRENCHAVETEPVATTITNTATCTDGGQITYTATFTRAPFNKSEFDSYRVYTVDVSALGHDWEDPSYVWDGVTEVTASHTCKRCKELESETSKTEDNKITVTEFPATCGHDKYTTYKATFTKFHFTTKTVVDYNTKTNHEWGTVTYDWADDNSHVVALQHCKKDWSHVQAVVAEATETITEKPTCTETGLAKYTATFSDPYVTQTKDVVIPALGHDWGAWVIVKAPTTSEKGLKERTCKHDSTHKETEEIPVLTPAPSNITPVELPLIYHIVEGADGSYAKNSWIPLDFTYKRTYDDQVTFSHFTGIEVDGVWLGTSLYTAVAGSVIITLNADYLETLAIGKHTITAYFDDGNAVTSDFYVGTPRTNRTPNTEDDNRIPMWALIEFYSITLSLIIIHKLRTMS